MCSVQATCRWDDAMYDSFERERFCRFVRAAAGRHAGARSAWSVLTRDSTCATCQGEIQTCMRTSSQLKRKQSTFRSMSILCLGKSGLQEMRAATCRGCIKVMCQAHNRRQAYHHANGSQRQAGIKAAWCSWDQKRLLSQLSLC